MVLYDLWKLCPNTRVFVHQHTCKKFSEELHEFDGLVFEAGRKVLDIKAENHPRFGTILVVEIER